MQRNLILRILFDDFDRFNDNRAKAKTNILFFE